MREIKIRVFIGEGMCHSDTKDNDILGEDEVIFNISHIGIIVSTFDLVDRCLGGEHEQTEEWVVHSEYPIMQHTGLKDKNGVEIYESDIVSDGHEQDNHCLSGIHAVKLEDGGYYPFSIAGWEGTMSISECEVIGNIYENPELLK